MFSQLLESHGFSVDRRPGLGATEIAFGALRTNAIDVYPEYTGTGLIAILHDSLPDSVAADPRKVFAHVARRFADLYHVRWLPPLGFQNTYAIAVTATERRTVSSADAERSRAGEPAPHGWIHRGFHRTKRWSRRAGARLWNSSAHGPAARAGGEISGARVGRRRCDRWILDGRAAVEIRSRHARGRSALLSAIRSCRARVRPTGATVASRHCGAHASEWTTRRTDDAQAESSSGGGRRRCASRSRRRARGTRPHRELRQVGHDIGQHKARSGFARYMWDRRATLAALTGRHLLLVGLALLAAVIVALPLGLALERTRPLAEPAIGALGVLQTIPSIALLAFMIPLLGVGVVPALVALWLYALYPIARGTYTGVRDADPEAVSAAEALGTTPVQRLMWVRLPLAAPVIMAGIRTAAVITVGAATLAAFIGAGGLGEPIVAGLALADTRMILSGALPAAALALAVDGVLGLVERLVAPAHRRSRIWRRQAEASV